MDAVLLRSPFIDGDLRFGGIDRAVCKRWNYHQAWWAGVVIVPYVNEEIQRVKRRSSIECRRSLKSTTAATLANAFEPRGNGHLVTQRLWLVDVGFGGAGSVIQNHGCATHNNRAQVFGSADLLRTFLLFL